MELSEQQIIKQYNEYLSNKNFACVAAQQAQLKKQVKCLVVDHMACAKDDYAILQFIYEFVDYYRNANSLFHSASVIFRSPEINSEEMFDTLLWQRLQSLSNLDSRNYNYDKRVDANPASENFSYSLKEEAFFIIGLHPTSSRLARRFKYPTIAFNPHSQFEKLRAENKYKKMQNIVRKRDLAFSGSVNPMLKDFGESSEVFQYSGSKYDKEWKCPLKINHGDTKHNSTS